jgi:hypothetical protein
MSQPGPVVSVRIWNEQVSILNTNTDCYDGVF